MTLGKTVVEFFMTPELNLDFDEHHSNLVLFHLL